MTLRAVLALAFAALLPPPPGAAEDLPRRHGLAMHGDLAYPADFNHFAYVNPQAPKGGTLEQAAIGTFDSFNPFIIKGNPATDLGLIYDRLMVGSADEPFSEYGLLAESAVVPEDRSWVSFELREQARWHDGRPVGADDVIWTFHTLVEKGAPFYRFYYANVERVEKIGPRTVKFSFKPGENRELPLILGQLVVLPRHHWEGRDFERTSLDPPLGSGPYRIGRFEPGRFIVYERVADYWGRNLPVNVGRHNFDALRFEYYRDETVAVEAFKGGAYDFRLENNSKVWATAYDTSDVKSGRIVKVLVPHRRPAGMQGFVFNLRRPLFQDARVRRALGFAFDFEWSNRTLFYDQYTRTRSYFDNSELAAEVLPGPAELVVLEPYRGRVPEEVFREAYEPPRSDGSGNLRAHLRRAVELLAAAGWSIVDGRMVRPESGEVLSFEILLVEPAFERIVLPFRKNLERIGVDVRVRTVDTSQYRQRANDFDFDVVVASFGQSSSPGNEQRDYWGSAAAERPGSRNWIGIRDPVIDELIEGLIAAPDREALVARTRALDRVLQWGHYVIPHWHIDQDRLVHWDRFGKPEITPKDGFQLDTWWFDPARAARLTGRGAGAP